MFTTVTLDTTRQTIVGNAVEAALAADRTVPLLAGTRARGEALVTASVTLRFFLELTPQLVDQATDTVVTAFRGGLETGKRALRDSAVPLGEPQREALGQYRMLQTRLFPKGTEYVRRSMDLQWGELLTLRAAMQEPEVAGAIDGLGLRPIADHLLGHIALYGRMLGKEAGSARAGVEEATAAWNEAMKMFVAQVLIDYEKDQATRQELLGVYEAQVEQQRAGYRAAARARKAAAEAEADAPDSSAPAVS